VSDTPLHALLGNNDDRDRGCDAGMELIDEYCEAVQLGRPIPAHLAPFIAHIENCVTCREDTDALLAALRAERQD
jgi:hypothetical protein